MNRDEIDTFSRCISEFRNSVIGFGEIISIDIEKQSMEAANNERRSNGLADAYGEDDFLSLNKRLGQIITKI